MKHTELIVDDDSYAVMAEYFKKTGESIDMLLEKYLKIVDVVQSVGIPSGSTAEAFAAFVSEVKKLQGQFSENAEVDAQQSKNFVKRIDKLDKYLF